MPTHLVGTAFLFDNHLLGRKVTYWTNRSRSAFLRQNLIKMRQRIFHLQNLNVEDFVKFWRASFALKIGSNRDLGNILIKDIQGDVQTTSTTLSNDVDDAIKRRRRRYQLAITIVQICWKSFYYVFDHFYFGRRHLLLPKKKRNWTQSSGGRSSKSDLVRS